MLKKLKEREKENQQCNKKFAHYNNRCANSPTKDPLNSSTEEEEMVEDYSESYLLYDSSKEEAIDEISIIEHLSCSSKEEEKVNINSASNLLHLSDEEEVIDESGASNANQLSQSRDEEDRATGKNNATDELDSLAQLLQSWDLFQLYELFKTKGVSVDALKVANERHVDKIFGDSSLLGLQIIFENKWIKWKQGFSHVADNTINVKSILQQSEMGQRVLSEFSNTKVVTPLGRTTIVHTIIQKYIETDQHITVKMFKQIAESIIKLFPSENVETYIAVDEKKRVKGKLWDRYQSRKRLLRSLKPKNSQQSTSGIQTCEFEEKDYDEMEILRLELMYIREWDLVKQKWKQTVPLRKIDLSIKSQQEVLQRWPLYKYPRAPELVDVDFRSSCQRTFSYEQWHNLCEIMPEILKDRLKDSSSKSLLEELLCQRENLDIDNLNIYWMKLLHAVLPPTTTVIEGKRKKFTIADSQKTFTLQVGQVQKIEKVIAQKLPTQDPTIVVVGKSFSFDQFYMTMGDSKNLYKFNSYLEAVDFYYKFIFIFKLKYSPECASFCKFIEHFCYDFPFKETNIRVKTFIADIKKQMKK